MRSRNIAVVLGALCAFSAACRFEERRVPQAARPSVKSDPCAERLHDLCGHLLMYHSLNRKLPDTLEDLKESGMGDLPPLTCPASGKPYRYMPAGMTVPGRDEIMVICDPVPIHSGMRWAVMVAPPESGQALATKVILLTERAVSTAGPLDE